MVRYRIAVCDDEPSELEDIVQSVKRYDVHGDFDIENYTDGAMLLSDLQQKKEVLQSSAARHRNAFKRISDGTNLNTDGKTSVGDLCYKAA